MSIGCYLPVPTIVQIAKMQVRSDREFTELLMEFIEMARNRDIDKPEYRQLLRTILKALNITVWLIEFVAAVKQLAESLPNACHYSGAFSTDDTLILIRPIAA